MLLQCKVHPYKLTQSLFHLMPAIKIHVQMFNVYQGQEMFPYSSDVNHLLFIAPRAEKNWYTHRCEAKNVVKQSDQLYEKKESFLKHQDSKTGISTCSTISVTRAVKVMGPWVLEHPQYFFKKIKKIIKIR